jgi:hypothetical protein
VDHEFDASTRPDFRKADDGGMLDGFPPGDDPGAGIYTPSDERSDAGGDPGVASAYVPAPDSPDEYGDGPPLGVTMNSRRPEDMHGYESDGYSPYGAGSYDPGSPGSPGSPDGYGGYEAAGAQGGAYEGAYEGGYEGGYENAEYDDDENLVPDDGYPTDFEDSADGMREPPRDAPPVFNQFPSGDDEGDDQFVVAGTDGAPPRVAPAERVFRAADDASDSSEGNVSSVKSLIDAPDGG